MAASTLAAMLVGVLLVTSGCDPAVHVLRPSEEYRFSMFGALNVAADTQVVRVEPLSDTVQIGAPSELGATVVLENLSTGREIDLRDSLSTVGAGVRVHNFWTTHPITPATPYRIIVRRDGEPQTTATTETPPRPPALSHNSAFLLPCLFPRGVNDRRRAENTFVVKARKVERIAAVDVIYPITYTVGERSLRTLNTYSHYSTVDDKGPFFEIPVFYRPDLVDINPNPSPEPQCPSIAEFTHPYALVAVSAGGPNWPETWRGLPLDRIASPDSFTNVEGGHGFVGGIYSDTIRVPVEQRPPPF